MDSAGEVRLEDAARLLGSASAKETRASLGELVYDEPGTGRLVPAAEYLSGKVRAKLRDAGQAAGDDPRFEVNVAALRRALPPDLGPGEIDGRLGASWIDPRYVQQGLREILEDPALTVEKGHGTAWTVTGSKTSVLATQVWGTEDKDAVSLAACLLEQRPVKVSPSRSDRDESAREKHQKRLQAAAATVTARAKADELNRRFGEWLWEDPERTADLVQTYNERFNSLVLRSYDGARPSAAGPGVVVPGMGAPAPARRRRADHQRARRPAGPRRRGGQDRRDGDGRDGAAPPRPGRQARDRGPQPHAGAVPARVPPALPPSPRAGRRERRPEDPRPAHVRRPDRDRELGRGDHVPVRLRAHPHVRPRDRALHQRPAR